MHGVVGITKVQPKELTTAAGFELETEKRKEAWEGRKPEEEEKFEFHARPAPKAILEKPAVSTYLHLSHDLIFVYKYLSLNQRNERQN